MASGYALSLLIGLMITAGIAMVFAALVGQELLGENTLGYGAMAAVFAGSCVAGIVAAVKIDLPKLVATAGSGLVLWLGLMLCGWLFFGKLGSGILPTAAICLGGALLVGLMGQKGSRKPKYKVPKVPF